MSTIYINTDGGSRGNPGPAGIGIVFNDKSHNPLFEYKEYIGKATNNQAEYRAIIKALEILSKSKWHDKCKNLSDAKVICRLDSKLVVEQICGNYKIKNENIIEYVNQIKLLINKLQIPIEFIHIRREENKLADKLVNRAIDHHVKSMK